MYPVVEIQTKTVEYINTLRATDSDIDSCLRGIEKWGHIYLFGGAVRDILTNHPPRDYDIVVDTKTFLIEEALKRYTYRKNRFNGYHVVINHRKFDIWSLDSTWAFRENLLNPSVENLTESVFFNLDSVAVNLSSGTAYATKFLQAVRSGVLDIVLEDNPFPELCVLRALVFKKKKKVTFSPSLKKYILLWYNKMTNPVEVLWEVQRKHYGYDVLSINNLQEELYDVV